MRWLVWYASSLFCLADQQLCPNLLHLYTDCIQMPHLCRASAKSPLSYIRGNMNNICYKTKTNKTVGNSMLCLQSKYALSPCQYKSIDWSIGMLIENILTFVGLTYGTVQYIFTFACNVYSSLPSHHNYSHLFKYVRMREAIHISISI